MVFAAAVLLVLFLQGGSTTLVYVAMGLALVAWCLPELARALKRRSAEDPQSDLDPLVDPEVSSEFWEPQTVTWQGYDQADMEVDAYDGGSSDDDWSTDAM